MPRVLSLSTLYPNDANPRFGTFVARSLEALQRETDWEVTVVNPIGMPPLPRRLLPARYRALAEAAQDGAENGVFVHRPRFALLPAIGGRFNPGAIARAVLPLVRELHRKTPFNLVDAQFFYPDGPAAAPERSSPPPRSKPAASARSSARGSLRCQPSGKNQAPPAPVQGKARTCE